MSERDSLSNMVSEAASIATSGRWREANEKIRKLASNPGENEEWWVQVIGSLCHQTFSEYHSLKSAYENTAVYDAPLLAWRARNLLELAVWSRYCTKSKENARRLYEDAGRDTRELYDKMLHFGKAVLFIGDQSLDIEEWSKPFEGAKKDLHERAKVEGIHSLDGHYQLVGKAAEECGILEHYNLMNKMFSKFAHPTALRILAPLDQEREKLQRQYFFRYGCVFFIGAFQSLESQINVMM